MDTFIVYGFIIVSLILVVICVVELFIIFKQRNELDECNLKMSTWLRIINDRNELIKILERCIQKERSYNRSLKTKIKHLSKKR